MIAYFLILLGLLLRIVPHAPNMAPVAAIALFAGAYLNRKTALWVPLAIIVISDLVIGLHDVVFYTWGAFFLIGVLGVLTLHDRRTPGKILGMTIASSLLFFAISNFGVWLTWYPRTLNGLIDCFIKALPFLRNTMVSNLLFGTVIFGAYELLRKMIKGSEARRMLLSEQA